jgi:hypothetical protein
MLTRLDTRVVLGKDAWSPEQRGQFGDLYAIVEQLTVAVQELVDAKRLGASTSEASASPHSARSPVLAGAIG